MVIQSFVFLDENSQTSTSTSLGNTNGTLLTLEVIALTEDEVSVVVEGRTEVGEDNWTSLGVIGAKKLNVLEIIVEDGNYFIPINGISSIRVVNNGTVGTVRVFGKVTNEV